MSEVFADEFEEGDRRTGAGRIGGITPHPNPLPQGPAVRVRGDQNEPSARHRQECLCHHEDAGDETAVSEVTISADGRVFVFGASRGVLEVLALLAPGDETVRRLLGQVKAGRSEAP